MALNLITPRYVAPDVTKSVLAGEKIRSSKAASNLAERKLAENRRQFNANLDLRAQVEAGSLAERRHRMEQEEALLPGKLLEQQERTQGQALSNLLSRQQLVKNEAMFPVQLEKAAADLEATVIQSEINSNNLANQRAQVAQMPKVNEWMRKANELAGNPKWGTDPTLRVPEIPENVTGANRTLIQRRIAELETMARNNGFGQKERKMNEARAMRTIALEASGAPDIDEHNRNIAEDFFKAEGIPVPKRTVPSPMGGGSLSVGRIAMTPNKWWTPFMDENGIIDKGLLQTHVKGKKDEASARVKTARELLATATKTQAEINEEKRDKFLEILQANRKANDSLREAEVEADVDTAESKVKSDTQLRQEAEAEVEAIFLSTFAVRPKREPTPAVAGGQVAEDDPEELRKQAERLVALGEHVSDTGGFNEDGKPKSDHDKVASWTGNDIDYERDAETGELFVQRTGWGWTGIGTMSDDDSVEEGIEETIAAMKEQLKDAPPDAVDEYMMKHFGGRWENGGRKFLKELGLTASRRSSRQAPAAPLKGSLSHTGGTTYRYTPPKK